MFILWGKVMVVGVKDESSRVVKPFVISEGSCDGG